MNPVRARKSPLVLCLLPFLGTAFKYSFIPPSLFIICHLIPSHPPLCKISHPLLARHKTFPQISLYLICLPSL